MDLKEVVREIKNKLIARIDTLSEEEVIDVAVLREKDAQVAKLEEVCAGRLKQLGEGEGDLKPEENVEETRHLMEM